MKLDLGSTDPCIAHSLVLLHPHRSQDRHSRSFILHSENWGSVLAQAGQALQTGFIDSITPHTAIAYSTGNIAQHPAVFVCMLEHCLTTFSLTHMGKAKKSISLYTKVHYTHLFCHIPGDLRMQSEEIKSCGLHHWTWPDLVLLKSVLYRKLILQVG